MQAFNLNLNDIAIKLFIQFFSTISDKAFKALKIHQQTLLKKEQ